MEQNFFSEMSSFANLGELTNEALYKQAPDDWIAIVTSIDGATKAIEEGRYKDVNMAAAAGLAAVMNSVESFNLPFVFAGDHTAILIPPSDPEKVKWALGKAREIAFLHFHLKMKIGLIPLSELSKEGAPIRLAKFLISEESSVAFFKGHGLQLAEKWMKEGKFHLPLEKIKAFKFNPFDGLHARWKQNSEGVILSILIKLVDEKDEKEGFFKKLITEIDQIVELDAVSSRPLKDETLVPEKKWTSARLEAHFSLGGFVFLKIWKRFLNQIFKRSWIKEKPQVLANADYRKFDETLRLVLDCSKEKQEKVQELLENYQANGFLSFGIHASPAAQVTSFRQMHFVDGNDGGLSSAAQMLKTQLEESDKIFKIN